MSPAQMNALRSFLLACLREPADGLIGGSPITFPDAQCYRGDRNQFTGS